MTAPLASAKILVADDDAAIRTVLTHALTGAGYEVACTDNAATLYRWADEGKGDLVITDVRMPGVSGLEMLPRLRQRRPDMQVIIISAQNALATAVAANEGGALEFLPKPFDVDELLATVSGALARRTDVAAPAAVDGDDIAQAMDKTFVLGQSRAMQDIYRTIARLRDSDLTVLITGESGTGKEVVARALHAYSRWKNGPFVAVNMAAIPRELVESELFGHEKGAFTGASQRHIGRFEQAQGGTLFLDEIGDMPMEAQTRLLRVLQEGEFNSVGGRRSIKTSLRIIAASHRDLAAAVKAGSFREDLYYRLNVIPLSVPPLRARAEDIAALAQHFLAPFGKVLSPQAITCLRQHRWPGNIRELENIMKRLGALTSDAVVDAKAIKGLLVQADSAVAEGDAEAQLAKAVQSYFAAQGSHAEGRIYEDMLALLEKPLFEEALSQTRGNQIRAAALLGLNRNTLRSKLRQLGIDVPREKAGGRQA